MDNLIYLAILIILSLISSVWKKKNKEKENTAPADDTNLEEELRRMAERMMGNKREENRAPATPTPVETFKSLRDEHSDNKKSPYQTYDNDEGDTKYEKYNRIPDTTPVNYSERDIERVEQQNESYKKPVYTSYDENYDQRIIESFNKGKELHSVMNDKNKKISIDSVERNILLDDFDPRKAFIYSEIFKRPEY